MASRSDLQSRWDILRETIRIASSLRQKLEDDPKLSIHHYPSYNPEPSLPPFVPPFPHELLAQISALPIPRDLRESIIQSLRSRILMVQQEYVASYKRTCQESSRSNFDDFEAIRKVYHASCERHYLPMVKSQVSYLLAEIARYDKPAASEVKRSFNTEYTPILEKYFEYNAYPSAQHQSILAEKSAMTRRQIEVWFQNHRNRGRKDNRPLRRNATDLPLRSALNLLQGFTMARSPSPSEADPISEDMDEDITPRASSCIEAFHNFRPRHAFPTTYPPDLDPFSGHNDTIKFPLPTWMREPASSVPARTVLPSLDVDELARMFHAKLNIFEGEGKRTTPSRTSGAPFPWYTATVTIPSKAPLPAFVRASSRPSSTFSPPSSIFSFQFPLSSRSRITTNAFLSPPLQETAKSRKISPLPRRLPTSFSQKKSKPRMSSFSSGFSSRSRSSSSSSRNRTPEPTTPPQLPTLDIPTVQDADHMHQRLDDFDCSSLFGDDPDILTATLPGSLDMPQSVDFAADKQPAMPAFDFGSLVPFAVPS